MIINTAGEYTLQYTATDACGNTTTVERDLVVEPPPRTVLYTDGTFIINERARDIEANIQAHGQPTNVYDPFDPNGDTSAKKYIFSNISQRPWNAQASSVKSVEIGSSITPTSTENWFHSFTTCTSIDLSLLDTSAVTDMSAMFSNCNAIITLDLSNFDTSAVTNMSTMFNYCLALTTLDITNFNTSAVTDMSFMFSNCRALTTLDLSNFNTSAVTNMSSMFNECRALTTLDITNFNTSLVTNMSNMFSGVLVLTTLDITNFNTSAVTNMSAIFGAARTLTTLDLSNFDTSLVTNMRNMFSGCDGLTTIYVSSAFVVSQVTDSTNMFNSMSTNLVGGAGTLWNSGNPKDKTYAHIDGGVSDPGYFTARP